MQFMSFKCAICGQALGADATHILCERCRVECGGFKKL